MKNYYEIDGNTVRIRIDSKKHGTQWALIDLDDLEKINRGIPGKIGIELDCKRLYAKYGWRPTKKLHRLIMDFPKNKVDHIEIENTLDNRKGNLRIVTDSESQQHREKQSNNISGYIGVCKHHKKRFVQVNDNGKRVYQGYFDADNARGAAIVRDIYALQYYGEFAVLNFPDKKEEYLQIMKEG